MRDHWIVDGISVFSDVEIFLDGTSRVREEGPVGTDSAAIFIRLGDIVSANRNKPAIGNLKLTVDSNKPFSLPPLRRVSLQPNGLYTTKSSACFSWSYRNAIIGSTRVARRAGI
jgi:hypothetical protein